MNKAVISFATTSHAIAMEGYLKDINLPGKLIPIPRQLSAGCGLAFKCDSDDIGKIEKILKSSDMNFEKISLICFK